MSESPACKAQTYLDCSTDEDGKWSVVAECNEIPGCGWGPVVLGDDPAFSIDSNEFLHLHGQHLAHRGVGKD